MDQRPLHDLDRRRLYAGRHHVHVAKDHRLRRPPTVVANQHVKAGDPLVRWIMATTRLRSRRPRRRSPPRERRWSASPRRPKRQRLRCSRRRRRSVGAGRGHQCAARRRSRQAAGEDQGRQRSRQLDDAQTAVDQAKAAVAGADAQIASANANIGVLEAQYAEAESTLRTLELTRDKAERDLSFTVLKRAL